MYRAIVYVGMLSAVLLSTEAWACGAEEKVVVNKGCGAAKAAVADDPAQPMCDASNYAESQYETAYNTCDGNKPADKEKDKDKGEGSACLSATGSAVCTQTQTRKSHETVFSYLESLSSGVCEAGSPVSSNASAGG